MQTERWQHLREFIYERDEGQCVICSRPGVDCHHWNYRAGFFNPTAISLLCRYCHLAWRGRDPDHLDGDNPYKALLGKVAEIARYLGLTVD